MIVRYTLLSIICCFLIYGCALPEDVNYNYDPNAPTIGLTVTPERLEFTPDMVNSSRNFELRFSTEELLLREIREPVVDPAVFNVIKKSTENCKKEVADTGVCTITVQYNKLSGTNNSKGSITLVFDYINDMDPEGHKEHILHFNEIPPKTEAK